MMSFTTIWSAPAPLALCFNKLAHPRIFCDSLVVLTHCPGVFLISLLTPEFILLRPILGMMNNALEAAWVQMGSKGHQLLIGCPAHGTIADVSSGVTLGFSNVESGFSVDYKILFKSCMLLSLGEVRF